MQVILLLEQLTSWQRNGSDHEIPLMFDNEIPLMSTCETCELAY